MMVNLFYSAVNGVSSDNPSSLAPPFAALVSVFLIGKKSSLMSKRYDLLASKRGVEALLIEASDDAGGGDGVGRALSGALCTQVFGKEAKATKIQSVRRADSKSRFAVVDEEGGEGEEDGGGTRRQGSKVKDLEASAAAPLADSILMRSARNLSMILPEAGGA